VSGEVQNAQRRAAIVYRLGIPGIFWWSGREPPGVLVGSLGSGLLLNFDGWLGLAGWQWPFIPAADCPPSSPWVWMVGLIHPLRIRCLRDDPTGERAGHTAIGYFIGAVGLEPGTLLRVKPVRLFGPISDI
jgi:hypothetical protein